LILVAICSDNYLSPSLRAHHNLPQVNLSHLGHPKMVFTDFFAIDMTLEQLIGTSSVTTAAESMPLDLEALGLNPAMRLQFLALFFSVDCIKVPHCSTSIQI